MERLRTLLEQQPLMALFLTIALGYVVGEMNVKGFSLGVGAVLFVALGVGWNDDPAVGYSVAYPFGVAGPILFLYLAFILLKPRIDVPAGSGLELLEIALRRPEFSGQRLGDLTAVLRGSAGRRAAPRRPQPAGVPGQRTRRERRVARRRPQSGGTRRGEPEARRGRARPPRPGWRGRAAIRRSWRTRTSWPRPTSRTSVTPRS